MSKARVWLTSASIAAQAVQTCRTSVADGLEAHMASSHEAVANASLESLLLPNDASNHSSATKPPLLSLDLTFPDVEHALSVLTHDQQLIQESYNGAMPQLSKYKIKNKNDARLLIAQRVTVKSGSDKDGNPVLQNLIANRHGQWFNVEQQQLHEGPILSAENVWYRVYDRSELQVISEDKYVFGDDLHTTVRRSILPAFQKAAACSPQAAMNLAIRAGLVAFRTIHYRSTGRHKVALFWTPTHHHQKNEAEADADREEDFSVLKLLALKEASQLLPLEKMNLNPKSLALTELEPLIKGLDRLPDAGLVDDLSVKSYMLVEAHSADCEVLKGGVKGPFITDSGTLLEAVEVKNMELGNGAIWRKDNQGSWYTWTEPKRYIPLLQDATPGSYASRVDRPKFYDAEVRVLPVENFEVYPVPHVKPADWFALTRAVLGPYYAKTRHSRHYDNCAENAGWFSGLQLQHRKSAKEMIVAIRPDYKASFPIVLEKKDADEYELVFPEVMTAEDYEVRGLCLVHAGATTPPPDMEKLCNECSVQSEYFSTQHVLKKACRLVNEDARNSRSRGSTSRTRKSRKSR